MRSAAPKKCTNGDYIFVDPKSAGQNARNRFVWPFLKGARDRPPRLPPLGLWCAPSFGCPRRPGLSFVLERGTTCMRLSPTCEAVTTFVDFSQSPVGFCRENREGTCMFFIDVWTIYTLPGFVRTYDIFFWRSRTEAVSIFFFHFYHHFYFPAQLVGGFALSDFIMERRGHRCLPFSPPVRAFLFIAHTVGFSIPAARRCTSNVGNSRSRAFR